MLIDKVITAVTGQIIPDGNKSSFIRKVMHFKWIANARHTSYRFMQGPAAGHQITAMRTGGMKY